jgi:hypothetical protein
VLSESQNYLHPGWEPVSISLSTEPDYVTDKLAIRSISYMRWTHLVTLIRLLTIMRGCLQIWTNHARKVGLSLTEGLAAISTASRQQPHMIDFVTTPVRDRDA